MFLLSLAALLRDSYRENNSVKQMNNYEKKYGFNVRRQDELYLATFGDDPKSIRIWEEATGKPYKRHMSIAEKNRAIYEVSLKEGWTYERNQTSIIGLPPDVGKNRVYDSEFQRACSGKSSLNWNK